MISEIEEQWCFYSDFWTCSFINSKILQAYHTYLELKNQLQKIE